MKSTLLVTLMIAVVMLAGACVALPQPTVTPAPTVSVMPENTAPGAVESVARRLIDQLEKQGYEVARGYFKLYTKEDCGASYDVMGTCFGNNPAAPYVMPVVPSWPDEWVDPATVGAELTGSADAFGTAVADPEVFFVYYFARDCAGLGPLTGKFCRSIPEAVLPTCNPEDPDCDILSFSLREYIRPGTQRGPDAALTLSPRVIVLQRP